MTPFSGLWTTGGAGDGASTYTRSDLSNFFKVLAACMDEEGVAPAYLSVLVPSTTGANNARIGTGGGLVDGKVFFDASVTDTVIPSASGGGNTRIDRIVLRADWTAQTVRITKIAGTDAASPTAPAITQTSGTTYDIKLCQALVDTGGTVTITDERTFARPGTDAIATAAIQDAAVTYAKIGSVTGPAVVGRAASSLGVLAGISASSDGEVLHLSGTTLGFGTIDNDSIGSRVPTLESRQGGSATDWNTAGTTTRTPTGIRIQTGAILTDSGGEVTVTFPVAFSAKPLVIACGADTSSSGARVGTVSTTQVDLSDISGTQHTLNWLAIGAD